VAKPYQKWLACFDNHGDQADPGAVKAFFEFKKAWKPDITIHGGDCFDLRALRKGASKDEEFEDVVPDVEAGLDFLRRLAPDVWLRGNHDERLLDAISGTNPLVRQFATLTYTQIVQALGDCQILPYDKLLGVYHLGKLKVIHGYNAGITAARMAAQIYGSCLMGHIHAVDAFSIAGLDRRIGRACGCLCKLSMPYNRGQAQTLRQQHGWAYGLVYPSGDFQVWQAECVAGQWAYPSEIRSVKHAG
jgi:predicted phosphodiesterase